MPGTTSSLGLGASGPIRRLEKVEEHVRQIRERAARPQKIPDAGTFPLGMALAVAGSLEQGNNVGTGESDIQGADWTFTDVAGEPVDLAAGSAGYITVGTAGNYRMQPHANVSWTGGQEPTLLTVSADWDGRVGPVPIWDRAPNADLHAVRETFPALEVHLAAGEGFWFGANWPNANACFVDDFVIRVTWLG